MDTEPDKTTPLLVGIGNDLRGDDAIGLEVARRVRTVAGGQVDVLESAGDVGQLLDAWTGRRLVLLVDAVVAGSAPGTIVRFDALKDGILPGMLARHTSSHGFGVNEAIELGRALDQMPDRLVVYGIEAGGFETGDEISPRVRRAIDETAASIMHDLGEFNVQRSTFNEAGGQSPVQRPARLEECQRKKEEGPTAPSDASTFNLQPSTSPRRH